MHRSKTSRALWIAITVVSSWPILVQCGKSGEETRTSWEDDLVVQRERYRRLGLTFDEAKAREDAQCIVRSTAMSEVIVVGGRRREPRGELKSGPPCDYDAVIMGPKTFIAGVEKATDRAMIFGGWRHSDEARKKRLLLDWFREGLAAGREVVDEAGKAPLTARSMPWHPARVELAGTRYTVEGWLRVPASGGEGERYELLRCSITDVLSFEGCTVVDRLAHD